MAALIKTLTKAFNSKYILPTPNPNFPNFLLISRRGIAFKLFVKGLSFYTSDKGLEEAFSQYGQVVEAKVVSDQVTDRSKGFGFVTFASEEEAHKALNDMNGKVLHGRVLAVEFAKIRYQPRVDVPIARGPPDPPRSSCKYYIDIEIATSYMMGTGRR
ncbi:hypothetical protein V2J09_010707 [Rumex salicifolius]